MAYTRTQLQTAVYADLHLKTTDTNRLPAATAQDALLLGEQDFARRTRCFRRTNTMSAVDEQAVYTLPEDFVKLIDLTYGSDTSPLYEKKERLVKQEDPAYRITDSGTPTHWWLETKTQFRLYPPSNVDTATTMALDGYFVPFSIGGGISGMTRSTTTLTVTMNQRHNLRAGDLVTASGSDVTAYNIAHTVATVPSATTFTATVADSGASPATGGYLYHTGGYLPMLADSDISYLEYAYQLAPRYYAVWWLSTNYLLGDEVAMASGQTALAKYEELVTKHEEDRWI